MMNKRAINMADELYVEKLHKLSVYEVLEETRDEAKQTFSRAVTVEERLAGLSKMLAIYLADQNYLDAFFMVEALINDPLMSNDKAVLLFQQGRISEFIYEFNDALGYYCRSMACPIIPDEIHHDLWNSMGFCWLYKQEFKSAEICCSRAIELDPKRWEAWKNLGISLEHQGYFQESLDAFTRAVDLSNGNEIAILYLWNKDQQRKGQK